MVAEKCRVEVEEKLLRDFRGRRRVEEWVQVSMSMQCGALLKVILKKVKGC